jgi:hypothetical protein
MLGNLVQGGLGVVDRVESNKRYESERATEADRFNKNMILQNSRMEADRIDRATDNERANRETELREIDSQREAAAVAAAGYLLGETPEPVAAAEPLEGPPEPSKVQLSQPMLDAFAKVGKPESERTTKEQVKEVADPFLDVLKSVGEPKAPTGKAKTAELNGAVEQVAQALDAEAAAVVQEVGAEQAKPVMADRISEAVKDLKRQFPKLTEAELRGLVIDASRKRGAEDRRIAQEAANAERVKARDGLEAKVTEAEIERIKAQAKNAEAQAGYNAKRAPGGSKTPPPKDPAANRIKQLDQYSRTQEQIANNLDRQISAMRDDLTNIMLKEDERKALEAKMAQHEIARDNARSAALAAADESQRLLGVAPEAPAPAAPKAAPVDDKVIVQDASGKRYRLPRSQLAEAIAQGFVEVK